jgi:hypothetical protein
MGEQCAEWAFTSTQCLVLPQSPAPAKNRTWYLQLHSHIQELSMVLHCQYYQILPLGGIVHTTTVESCTINLGFYGVGLPHLEVEALTAISNKLLMHYGCNTTTG